MLDHKIASSSWFCIQFEPLLQGINQNLIINALKISLLILNRIDKSEHGVSEILVDAASSRLSSCKSNFFLLEQLSFAFFPGILVLANDDTWLVAPQE